MVENPPKHAENGFQTPISDREIALSAPDNTRAAPHWPSIRHQFETTNISCRALAEQHGLASSTTLFRRRDAEGWTRDLEAITAGLVTEAVALTAAQAPPLAQPAPAAAAPAPGGVTEALETRRKLAEGWAWENEGQDGPTRGGGAAHTAHSTAHTTAHTLHTPPVLGKELVPDKDLGDFEAELEAAEQAMKPPRVCRQEAAAEQQDQKTLQTAASMAQIQSKVIAESLEAADKLTEVGLLILGAMKDWLTHDPEEPGASYRAGHLLKLGEKDTLASAATSAATMLDKGAGIKRRAVGLEANNKALGTPEAPVAHTPAYVEQMLRRLPRDALFELRQVTLEMSRNAPSIPTVEHEPVPTHDP